MFLLIRLIDLVGHVLTHRPQPKHLAWLKTSFLSTSCLAWNWHRSTHVPQLLQVSVLFSAIYSEATTWSGMPKRSMAFNEPQQQLQQLHMTSGFSSFFGMKAMWTSPASCVRFRMTNAWANEILLAPSFIASRAWLLRVRHTSTGASHLCHFPRQMQSLTAMVSACLKISSTLVKLRIVCCPWIVILTGIVTGVHRSTYLSMSSSFVQSFASSFICPLIPRFEIAVCGRAGRI